MTPREAAMVQLRLMPMKVLERIRNSPTKLLRRGRPTMARE
jgi:hypothetical protein